MEVVDFTVSVILLTVDFNAVETTLVSTGYFGGVVTSSITCVKEGEETDLSARY